MTDTESSTRIKDFQQEVDSLQVTGGKANPEKRLLTAGLVLGILGLILIVAAFFVSRGTATDEPWAQRDMIILAILGAGLVVVGAVLYVANKLTRFFRYWLVRLIYEHRAQTDRLDK